MESPRFAWLTAQYWRFAADTVRIVPIGQTRCSSDIDGSVCSSSRIFDDEVMNRTLARSITPILLLSLVGCAHSATRQADESREMTPEAQSPSESSAIVVSTPQDNREFVLGEVYNQDAVPSYTEAVESMSLEQVRAELEEMYEHDRDLVSVSYDPDRDPQSLETVQAIDRAHAERLKEIVGCIGWPTRDLVGLKATQAAYMVIQHAGHDVEFQNECLEMMVDLVAQGELPASYVALLTDRIRVFSGQPQVFGTQMQMARNDLGVLVPTPTVPIEDPDHLNDRRALMGMVAHEQFVEAIQLAYEASHIDTNSSFASYETDSE